MEQYVKYPPMTDWQIEQMQEQLFREYGPFYHLSTKPLENGVIFECEDERKVAINLIAILAKETHVDILAFAISSKSLLFHSGLDLLVIPGCHAVIPGLTRNLKTSMPWHMYT